MKEKNEYRKDVAFINREKEMRFLNLYISERPEKILFLHGPKSSGKTTLLYRFLDDLKKFKKIEVKFLNLREVYLGNYQDFLRVFFEVDYKNNKKRINIAREYNLKVFKLSVEELKELEEKKIDPFVVMKTELRELVEKGIKPIIIIDELQALMDIYINGQRTLIQELFNFFVAMTKESHLAYVIISSSDGYFIDVVYNDSKLKKTSDFYEVDYLQKEDVIEWLGNLEKYSKIREYTLTEEEIEKVWDTVGGSMWEIQLLLSRFFEGEVEEVCEDYKIKMRNLIDDYIKFSKEKKIILEIFTKKIRIRNSDLENINIDKDKIEKLLADMVHNNILYYNPVKAEYYPQGRSYEWGIKLYFEKN
ncbi:MAG TPA: ATP-binding protein [bacterium]|nr:ATP-binding protein [bacterium]